jgi:hypothetical protein
MQVKKIDCNNSLPVPILFSCPRYPSDTLVPGLYISSQATTNTEYPEYPTDTLKDTLD